MSQPRRTGSNHEQHAQLQGLFDVTTKRSVGTIMGFAVGNFAIIAADVSAVPALHEVRSDLMLASTGCWCDTAALVSLLRARIVICEKLSKERLKTRQVAEMFSMLLQERFSMPSHADYMMAGFDELGKGVIYAYDLIGAFTATAYRSLGLNAMHLHPWFKSNRSIEDAEDTLSKGNQPDRIVGRVEAIERSKHIIENAYRALSACGLQVKCMLVMAVLQHKQDTLFNEIMLSEDYVSENDAEQQLEEATEQILGRVLH